MHNFKDIPQSAFPTQHDDEKIFIFVRRYYYRMVLSLFVIALLVFVPIIFAILGFPEFSSILANLTVLVDDLIILMLTAYYLALASLAVTYFSRYYNTQLIVTNIRIYQTSLNGIFNILPNEFSLEEITEVSFRARGILGMLFNVGDISIHLEGVQQDYLIQAVQNANMIAGAITSLVRQANDGVPDEKREPYQDQLACIESRIIRKGETPPELLNFGQSIRKAQEKYKESFKVVNWKDKLDLWWWTQLKKEHTLYIDYQPTRIRNLSKTKGEDEGAKK